MTKTAPFYKTLKTSDNQKENEQHPNKPEETKTHKKSKRMKKTNILKKQKQQKFKNRSNSKVILNHFWKQKPRKSSPFASFLPAPQVLLPLQRISVAWSWVFLVYISFTCAGVWKIGMRKFFFFNCFVFLFSFTSVFFLFFFKFHGISLVFSSD